MSIRLENIDELRKRANVSYEDAKDALENCNDDIVEALIYLEKQNKIKPEQSAEQTSEFWTKVKNVIKKGNNTKLIIRKKDYTVLSLPVTAAVIISIFAPYITVVGILIALLTGHRIKFEGKNGECTQVNDTLNKVSDTIDTAKKKLAEDIDNSSVSTN